MNFLVHVCCFAICSLLSSEYFASVLLFAFNAIVQRAEQMLFQEVSKLYKCILDVLNGFHTCVSFFSFMISR